MQSSSKPSFKIWVKRQNQRPVKVPFDGDDVDDLIREVKNTMTPNLDKFSLDQIRLRNFNGFLDLPPSCPVDDSFRNTAETPLQVIVVEEEEQGVGESATGLMERIGQLEETQKETLNLLKRQFDDSQTFGLSTMNTDKRLRLCARYGVREQVVWITLDDFQMIGDTPRSFPWTEDSEDSHSVEYTSYIRDDFLGSNYLFGYEVKDVHANNQLWNTGFARGTADVVVYPPIALRVQDVITLAFELKKQVTENDENQAIGELIASNAVSSKKPVVMLTDFNMTFTFFWIGPSQDQPLSDVSLPASVVYGIKFSDIHQASSFARSLLVPDVVNSTEIRDRLPLFENRAVIIDSRLREGVNDDIANLDDFVDEMEPEERASYEITKKLKRYRPFVPPTFREWYPTKPFPLAWYL